MQNFLSSIDIGVFDLDEVLQHGFSHVIPDRFRNKARQTRNQAVSLERERKRLLKIMGTLTKEQQTIAEKKLSELKKQKFSKINESQEYDLNRKLRGQTFTGTLKNFSTTWAGRASLALFGALIRDIQKTFTQITETVDQTGFFSSRLLKDYDAIAGASKDLLLNNQRLYNTADQNFETFIGLRRAFGATENLSVKLLDNVSQLENIIGLSNEEATGLLTTLKGINRQTVQANSTLIKTFSILANQNGVAFRDVMEDITENGDFFATFMSRSSEKIGEMIIKTRRLGVSFSSFKSIFDSFSDIESTLEKQARLSIFSGKRMDFIGVLSDLYSGNVEGARTSIMNQLGGINKGLFDNPFVKQQLSEGFGVDVQTLNKLFKASRGGLSGQDIINRDLQKSLEKFNENFKQLGFGTLKKDFTQFILNPMANMFKDNREQIQSVFEGIGAVIKGIGFITTNIGKFIAGIHDVFNKTMGSFGSLIATVGTISGAVVGISKLRNAFFSTSIGLDTQRNSLLNSIRAILLNPLDNHPGSLPQSNFFANTRMGRGLRFGGMALAGVGTALGAGALGYASPDDRFDAGGLLTSIGTGALTGGMLGAPTGVGAIGGALIGGALGAGSYFLGDTLNDRTVKMNRGGIFKKRFTGKMDVAEGGKPEGFVPLETQDGKPTMPVNLSDDTIRKLAMAMSNINMGVNVRVDGGKTRKEEFYSHVMNPSLSLNA